MMKASTMYGNVRRLPADTDAFVPWFAIGQKAGRRPPWPHPQLNRAIAGGLCWLCGRPNPTQPVTFVLRVQGALERKARDPGCHWGCAHYAAKVWVPNGRLGWFHETELDPRLAWLSDEHDPQRGIDCAETVVLWQTDEWEQKARHFTLGEPSRVEWYRQGVAMAGVPIDPDSYLGALAERHKLAPLFERLRPWLP